MYRNHTLKRFVVVAGSLGVIIGGATDVVEAAPKPRVDISATGSWSTFESWQVVLEGEAIGLPFDGTLTGTAHAQDGTLPTGGACESGSASVRVADSAGNALHLVSAGEVCQVVTPFGDEWVYGGTFDVTETTSRRVKRSSGVLGIRLWADGTLSVRASGTN